MGETGVSKMNAALNISARAVEHLSQVHEFRRTIHLSPDDFFLRDPHIQFLRTYLEDLPDISYASDVNRSLDTVFLHLVYHNIAIDGWALNSDSSIGT